MAGRITYGFLIFFTAVAMVVAVCRGKFVDQAIAERALEVQGFSNVQITSSDRYFVSMKGCDGSDAAKFTAVALNPAGRKVGVYVCVGWPWKGATVRSN